MYSYAIEAYMSNKLDFIVCGTILLLAVVALIISVLRFPVLAHKLRVIVCNAIVLTVAVAGFSAQYVQVQNINSDARTGDTQTVIGVYEDYNYNESIVVDGVELNVPKNSDLENKLPFGAVCKVTYGEQSKCIVSIEVVESTETYLYVD